MKNKLSVTIGIPAYNEEKNVKFLINSILSQKETNFEIQKVVVISDASIDDTNQIVSAINDSRIMLIKNSERKGQYYCQNIIFSLAKSDVVVLFEADSCPKNNFFLEELLKPIFQDKDVGFVQGNPQPLPPVKLLEKIFFAHDTSYFKFAYKENHNEDLFISGVAGRAFRREVYKKLVWPKEVPEDSYAYLWLKKNKVKMIFRQSAICYYRLPQTIKDHLIKKQKVISGQKELSKYFSLKPPKTYFLPKSLLFKVGAYFFITQPFLFIGYLVVKLIDKLKINQDKFTDYWSYPYSTKTLFKQKLNI